MAPIDVRETNIMLVYNNLYGKKLYRNKVRRQKYHIGDHVRISKLKMKFDKGYEQNWTDEIFKIKEVIKSFPIVYKLEDLSGEDIDGIFYTEEIQKVIPHSIFKIDKILNERGTGTSKEVLVKWKGYPTKFNYWIKQSDLILQ